MQYLSLTRGKKRIARDVHRFVVRHGELWWIAIAIEKEGKVGCKMQKISKNYYWILTVTMTMDIRESKSRALDEPTRTQTAEMHFKDRGRKRKKKSCSQVITIEVLKSMFDGLGKNDQQNDHEKQEMYITEG
jgi:phosphopantetheinyl transferase